MSLADNKAIKIPETHYVGFQKRGKDEIPLGFMTPDGTDSAATKRKQTVNNWASRSSTKLPPKTFDNKPLSGFKFGDHVRHGYGWGQGNVKWRIEDPRGFELEISSPNLAQIMAITTLENGEILEQCIWGRLGSENILIPVTSDVYKAAVANTARMNTIASLKDLKIGYNVVLQNGIEGRYMGYLYEVEISSIENILKTSGKKKHIVQTADGVKALNSLKLSAINQTTELTAQEAERELNKGNLKFSSQPLKDIKVRLEELSLADVYDQTVRFAIGKTDQTSAIVSRYYLRAHSGYAISGSAFDIQKLITDNSIVYHTEEYRGYYARNKTVDLDPKSTTWYKIIVSAVFGNGDTVEIVA